METIYVTGQIYDPTIPSLHFQLTFQDGFEIRMEKKDQTLSGCVKNIELPHRAAKLFLEQFSEKMEDGSWNMDVDKIPSAQLLLFLAEHVYMPAAFKWLMENMKKSCNKELPGMEEIEFPEASA